LQEIYFIRHGSVDNPDGINYARRPGFPLNGRGIHEAKQSAEFLAGRGIQIIYHSPLERCVQTADIIAASINAPLIESPEINEWDENESIRDVASRMATFWLIIHAGAQEKAAVVSHRDAIRALLIKLSGKSLSEIYNPECFPLEPGGIWLAKPGSDKTELQRVFTPELEAQ